MEEINFTKMVGTGNDFVVLDARCLMLDARCSMRKLAYLLCHRRTGIGADGLLVLENSKKVDFRMRIFNADGSEAEMCGNGLRCVVLHGGKKKTRVATKAGIYEAEVIGKNNIRIKMKEPKSLKLNLAIMVDNRSMKVNYIDTGVPHTLIFVQGLDEIDVESIGRKIRYHPKFKPKGTNVDFVEIMDDKNIKMRTYERGVEGETLACGTGALASAVITNYKIENRKYKINVHTKGGILRVHFDNVNGKIKNVYLEGEAKEVFRGTVLV